MQLNQKLEELKNLKAQLEDLMAQYNEKENIKIASLVKIYENMKPKDAAKIFEELDMPILLQVVNVMKESKVLVEDMTFIKLPIRKSDSFKTDCITSSCGNCSACVLFVFIVFNLILVFICCGSF